MVSAVTLGGSATIPETQPTISSFTPTVIDADVDTITITGQNFASIPKVELQRANGAKIFCNMKYLLQVQQVSQQNLQLLFNKWNLFIIFRNPDGNAVQKFIRFNSFRRSSIYYDMLDL